ncbi:MAG: transporter substrate-binding domain-containing protein [Microbacterium sp.]
MIRKSLVGTVAAVAVIGLLAGCSPTTATPEPSSPSESAATGDQTAASLVPDKIRASGELLIGNSPVFPPMSFLPNDSGNDDDRVGVDVDLATALAEVLDLKPVFQRQQYEQYLPSLGTGRLDIVFSAMQDLESRHGTATFVDYSVTGPQLFTTADRTDLKDVADLCGKTVLIGVANTGDQDQVTAASERECSGNPIKIETATDNAAALTALKQGRADATIRGAETVGYLMTEIEPDTYRLIGDKLATIPVGIAVGKANAQLVDAVYAGMEELMANGTYQSIIDKWKVPELAIDEPMVDGKAR